MRLSLELLIVTLALLVKTTEALSFLKCCEPSEILDVASLSCVPAPWGNMSALANLKGVKELQEMLLKKLKDKNFDTWGTFVSYPSLRWLREWAPTGIPQNTPVWAGNLNVVLQSPLIEPVSLWPVEDVILLPSSAERSSSVTPSLLPTTTPNISSELPTLASKQTSLESTTTPYSRIRAKRAESEQDSSPQPTLSPWDAWEWTLFLGKSGTVGVRHSWTTEGRTPELFKSYCVDKTTAPTSSIMVVVQPVCRILSKCIKKCCPHGQILSLSGENVECKVDDMNEWIPINSSLTQFLDPEEKYVLTTSTFVSCDGHFSILSSEANDFEQVLQKDIQYLFSTRYFCADYYDDGLGKIRETVAYCSKSRITSGVYVVLRSLSGISTVLLLAALALIIRDPKMRSSTHGRALFCHATCLFAFNLEQVVFSYSVADDILKRRDPLRKYHSACKAFAFAAYFFMTAAAFWLTIVCVNMTLGFRIQERKRDGGGKRIFLWFSLVAWGLPTILTLIASLLFQIKTERSWYLPSFSETRTCFHDLIQVKENVPWYQSNKHGGLLYYYAPMGLLICINTVCLILVFKRIRFLQQGKSTLRKQDDGSGAKSSEAQSIMVYVKLIQFAGILELIAEVSIWSTTTADTWRERDREASNRYTALFRAAGFCADLLRAVTILWLTLPRRSRRVRESSSEQTEKSSFSSWLSKLRK